MEAPNPEHPPEPHPTAQPDAAYPDEPATPGSIGWSLQTLYGWLHPSTDTAVDVATVVEVLARHGAVAAVAGDDDTSTGAASPAVRGASREFVVLITPDDTIACVGAGDRLEPGVTVTELARELAETTGHAVDLGDVVMALETTERIEYGVPQTVPVEHEVGRDVLLTRMHPDHWPLLARHLGCAVEVEPVPGSDFVLVRPCAPTGHLHQHRFGGDDLPVVALSRLGETRYVALLTRPGHLPGAFLSRQAAWISPLDEGAIAHLEATERSLVAEALAWFADPHLAPDSELQMLCTSGGFGSDIDPERVAAALQTRVDVGWSHRVLSAMGLPTLLSDVHEGRADLSDPQRVEPGGLGTALGTALADALRRPFGRHPGRGGRPSGYSAT